MKATPTVQVDNERVIVTEWKFAPGAETGQHSPAPHPPAGVSHNVINANPYEFRFIEIELKRPGTLVAGRDPSPSAPG